MSQRTKIILIIGAILLIYGYVCRLLTINFFWDSRSIGWVLMFIGLLSYWMDLRRIRKQTGKKTFWVTLGICFLAFGLIILPVVIYMLKTSDAYNSAIEFLKNDPTIKKELGDINGFGLITTGSVSTTTINGVESGNATFEIMVRGDKKFKDVTIELTKMPDEFWSVIDVR